ncbi:hypothetical protein, partial [Pseudomonas sp. GM24]|uniref:hypothetical protein n=1 Tax=Pseudomonas sp. GM24 TaxID=1144326 RepID=UPI001EE66074
CDRLIFLRENRINRSQPSAAPTWDGFYSREIIGCIDRGSNLKCTTRLVLRAIIEHNGGLAN